MVSTLKSSPKACVPLEVGALYVAHAQRVAHWAARLAGPLLDVEDVVQEVFLTAHQQLHTFRGEAQITTWLYRVTENVVRHRRRKERLRRWLRGSRADLEIASSRPTPLEELEKRQATEQVYLALDNMNERYRTIIILFELEGLPGHEVAELTGTKVTTLWVLLHRARAQFLSRLAKLERRSARQSGE